jgi:hypothetical protein
MDKQPTPIKIWNTLCDANVELFRARMNFSAEMFDLYTKWPRKSFSEATEAMKAAHLESLKILADKTVEKKAAKKADKPAAKAKAKPAPKKRAQPAPKAKPVAAKAAPARKAAQPAPKPEAKPAEAAPKAEAAAPKPAVEAAKRAAKAGAKPVTLPEIPDFIAKPLPDVSEAAPSPAATREKDH